MRRIHLIEIEDQRWCPRAVRDGATDWLQYMASAHRAFNAMAPKLRNVMTRFRSEIIVDLCSGGGGPWASLEPLLAQSGAINVQLTDYYPNLNAMRRASLASNGRIAHCAFPIDATNVSSKLRGVRTMFNAFHHFRPSQASAILSDAVRKRRPIVVVEGSDSRVRGIALILLLPLLMLLLTPRVRPFRWSRLLLTYLLPVIPLLVLWDGIVSMLRIYNPDELRELVARVPDADTFEWDIGVQPVKGSPLGLTYLIGVPCEAQEVQASNRTGTSAAAFAARLVRLPAPLAASHDEAAVPADALA